MKALWRWLVRTVTRTLVWTGPALTLLLAVAGGFLMWTLTTQQGARWLLVSVARHVGGDVHMVQGTVWDGVRVGELTLPLPGASVTARDAQLAVDWLALLERRVHVRTLSAGALVLDVQVPDMQADTVVSSGIPDWMAWPVSVELDTLDLAGLDVRINGKPLPVRVDAISLAARFTAGRGQTNIQRLALTHDMARLAVQGDVSWQLDGMTWQAADVNLRLLDLQTDLQAGGAPVHVDALAFNAHLTPRGGSATLGTLALSHPLGHALGNAQAQAEVAWQWQAGDVTAVDVNARLLDGARWNGQALSGTVRVQANRTGAPPSAAVHEVVQAWTLPALALDAALGENRVIADGAFGRTQDRLNLDIHLPALAQFWPQLAGSLRVQGHAGGGALAHTAVIDAVFTPENTRDIKNVQDSKDTTSSNPLTVPVHAALTLSGTWEHPGQAQAAWRARVAHLQIDAATLQVRARQAFVLDWQPQARDWPWTIGAAPMELLLNKESVLTLAHQQSRFGGGSWETRGAIAQLHVTDARIAQWQRAFPWLAVRTGNETVRTTSATTGPGALHNDIVLDTDWQLRYGDTLEGQWRVRRKAGDLIIPWDPPVPAGLRDLDLRVAAVRTAPGHSRVQGTLNVQTETMGALTVQAQTRLRGDWQLDTPDNTVIEAQSDMADLGWLSLFTSGLPVELGGAVSARIKAQHRADGRWTTQGNVTGTGLRVVYPDEGVRLLDGTLDAHFDDERFVLDSLRFPARLRVEPRERRTRTWVKTDPAARNGSLNFSGDWHLPSGAGQVVVTLTRYPLLQRSDRHAMFSGTLHVDAALDESRISIGGELTADAGWVDLDIVSGVPALDGDVVVQRAGAVPSAKPAPRTDVALDLSIDLGPRFYLTGYGLDSGLTGKLRLRTQDGRLRADGALDTRGGTVSAYGQQLRLLRGNLTFQGDASSPVLDIVAMRAGDAAVQAGVRVGGTARRPRIDLMSIPEVSDVEKLSWLLLGRGPDNAGGDAALLLSVGSSFFTGGEPFYRQFGLDELSMRSGALGATGSLLPVETVVRSLDAGVSDIERQFIVASKNISQDFSVSIEQALSDTGTVGRISYRLARGLNASLSVGTVNGLALVYRWFSRD